VPTSTSRCPLHVPEEKPDTKSPASRGTNREALLEGALRCLQEQGYARTTARDIVAASGANLGAIGYHYGSTERLLNEALLRGFERWYAELVAATERASGEEQPLPVIAAELGRTFERNRPLVRSFIEALAQSDQSPEIRAGLVDCYERGRELVSELVAPLAPAEPRRRLYASLLLAVFDGLLIQWLVDPEHAPGEQELVRELSGLATIGEARG
jgi:AcrR family transcriptional regulator